VTKQPPAPARQMHDLPGSNPIRPGRGPEDRLRDLQRRFRAVSARHDRTIKLRGYYRRLGIAALAAIVALAVVWGLSSHWPVMTTPRQNAKSAATIEQAQIQVIDGDTIRANGQVYRLVGYDAPESGLNAKCESERTLAARATSRLRQIVAAGGLRFERVPCALPIWHRRHAEMQLRSAVRRSNVGGPRCGCSHDRRRIGPAKRRRPAA
jgi:hypothetical protein